MSKKLTDLDIEALIPEQLTDPEARRELARWYRKFIDEGKGEELRQLLAAEKEWRQEQAHQARLRKLREDLQQVIANSELPLEQRARKPGRKPKRLQPLQQLIKEHPDWTNQQLADGYKALAGISVSSRWVSANRNAQK
jgi:hypothetical protein